MKTSKYRETAYCIVFLIFLLTFSLVFFSYMMDKGYINDKVSIYLKVCVVSCIFELDILVTKWMFLTSIQVVCDQVIMNTVK